MMGGTYRVQSEEGKGSVFSFQIPFALPEAPLAAAGQGDGADKSGARPLTVLLAEDNPINQIYVQELLEMDGHSVVVAHTGRRALEELRKQRFDVILMPTATTRRFLPPSAATCPFTVSAPLPRNWACSTPMGLNKTRPRHFFTSSIPKAPKPSGVTR